MPKLFTRIEENPIYIECYEQYGEIGLCLFHIVASKIYGRN